MTTNPYGYSKVNLDDWDLVGHFYQGPSDDEYRAYAIEHQELDAKLVSLGFPEGDMFGVVTFHKNGGCASCGSHFFHGVVVHKGKEVIAIGGICANKWGSEQARVIATAKATSKREKFAAQGVLFAERKGITEALEVDHYITIDIKNALRQYGSLSPKQVDLVKKIANDEAERKERFAERDAQLLDAPALEEGRYTITGKVISTKSQESIYGTQYKMLVELENGNRVWGTIPSIIWDVERGSRVRFDAAVERSKDDDHFGFYKRPTKPVMTHHADGRENTADAEVIKELTWEQQIGIDPIPTQETT